MFWNTTIELGVPSETIKSGVPVNDFAYRVVFANKLNLSRSEKEQGNLIGLKPKLKFEIKEVEYELETRAKVNGIEYEIVETKENQKYETLELILSSVTGVGMDGS